MLARGYKTFYQESEPDEAYEQTEGPASPTGSPADEVRRLAAQLGLDGAGIDQLIEVFGRRPMRG